jgi:hypothetical protein
MTGSILKKPENPGEEFGALLLVVAMATIGGLFFTFLNEGLKIP